MSKTIAKSTLLGIAAIVLLLTYLVQLASFFVAYPTAEHIRVADQRGLMSNTFESTPDPMPVATSESRYSDAASAVVLVVQLVIYAGGVSFLYVYLRKNHVTNPGGTTAGIFAATQAISWTLSTLFLGLFVSIPTSWVFWLLNIVMVFFGTLVASVLIIIIVEKIYNSRHSFTVE